MTKPSDFILNSDYLSIAQISKNSFNITIGAGSLVVNGNTQQNFDFPIKLQPGAIDRIMISKDYGDYLLGSYMELIPTWEQDYSNNVRGYLRVFRTSSSTIRAQLSLDNYGQGTSTYPMMTFTIKVSSFCPPNVL